MEWAGGSPSRRDARGFFGGGHQRTAESNDPLFGEVDISDKLQLPPQRYVLDGLVISSAIELTTLRLARPADDATSRQLRVALAVNREPSTLARWKVLYSAPRSATDEAPYLTVARHEAPVPGDLSQDLGTESAWFVLRIHDVVDFFVDAAGEAVVCAPTAACPRAALEQIFVDQIIPRVLHLRGEACLHASAVQLADGRVVALSGPSGAGKSTTCAALSQRGAPWWVTIAYGSVSKGLAFAFSPATHHSEYGRTRRRRCSDRPTPCPPLRHAHPSGECRAPWWVVRSPCTWNACLLSKRATWPPSWPSSAKQKHYESWRWRWRASIRRMCRPSTPSSVC